jgi:hypothetical protein
MRTRIAALVVALGFLAAPASGVASSCPPCCPQAAQAPCEAGELGDPGDGCAAMPCCAVAPYQAPSIKQALEAPILHPVPNALRAATPAAQQAFPPRLVADLKVLTSPRRLSVVLLI